MPPQDVAPAPGGGPCHDIRRARATSGDCRKQRAGTRSATLLRAVPPGRRHVLKGIRLGPTSLKHSARQFADAWASVRRSRALERAIRTLRHAVRAGRVSPDVCQELRVAWGNPGWTADAEFLAAVASRAPGHGPVLECGSGLTTLILGVIADEHGSNVWTLEQDHRWSRYMDGVLRRFAIRSVALWHAPLVGRGDFVWFDLGARRLPPQLARVVCDGPAVLGDALPEPIHTSWRVGVVPERQRIGIRSAEILLADGDERRCPGLRRRWEALGVATRVVRTA